MRIFTTTTAAHKLEIEEIRESNVKMQGKWKVHYGSEQHNIRKSNHPLSHEPRSECVMERAKQSAQAERAMLNKQMSQHSAVQMNEQISKQTSE